MEYGCCGYASNGNARGFLTRKEKIEMLKEYREHLDKEAKGVSERISELEKEK